MPNTNNISKQKPTALKKLQGTYRPDRDGGADDALNKKKPVCPSFLDKDAKAEWRRVVNDLYDAGLLRNVDRTALANYCQLFSTWKQATELVQEKGLVIKTSNGNIIQSPALGIANVAAREMMKALQQFGMTPVSRARLEPDKPEEKEESLDAQLFRLVNGG